MVKKYLVRTVLFLLPVVLILGALEFWVRNTPSSPETIARYLEKESEHLEVMVLGASQNQGAIHPKFLTKPAINMASGHQDYTEDFHILSQLKERIPKLNTVILAMTFAHFDTPPNKPEYWKHATLLNYYGVNAYRRTVYAKDKLLYLSNPSYYSKELLQTITPSNVQDFGTYGYSEKSINNAFEKADYDLDAIESIPLSLNNRENPLAVKENTAMLQKILAYCEKQKLEVYILLTPATEKHLKQRNPNMVSRRDAILKEIQESHPKIRVINGEQINYPLTYFRNYNHLNAQGAEMFTKAVNEQLETAH